MLGLGTGWLAKEHAAFAYPSPPAGALRPAGGGPAYVRAALGRAPAPVEGSTTASPGARAPPATGPLP